jgi:hypothetical protein
VTSLVTHPSERSPEPLPELVDAITPLEPLWVDLPKPAPDTSEDDRERHPRLRRTIRRRLLIVLVVAAGLVLSVVLYVFLSYEFRSTPGAKSVHSAISAFHAGRDASTANLRYPSPAQGVYELSGRGNEHISFPPNSQHDGSVMPASVTYLPGGCWRWHLDYNVAHWEEYDFCPGATGLVQRANRNSQAWDFGTLQITNLATFSCPANTVVLPDTPMAGKTIRWTCQGTSTAVKGTATARVAMRVIASSAVTLGNHQEVAAIHEIQTTTLSGAQKGTVVENWWFSASSGLPLRVDRQIQITTASPLGAIHYSENGSWRMTSLAPRR